MSQVIAVQSPTYDQVLQANLILPDQNVISPIQPNEAASISQSSQQPQQPQQEVLILDQHSFISEPGEGIFNEYHYYMCKHNNLVNFTALPPKRQYIWCGRRIKTRYDLSLDLDTLQDRQSKLNQSYSCCLLSLWFWWYRLCIIPLKGMLAVLYFPAVYICMLYAYILTCMPFRSIYRQARYRIKKRFLAEGEELPPYEPLTRAFWKTHRPTAYLYSKTPNFPAWFLPKQLSSLYFHHSVWFYLVVIVFNFIVRMAFVFTLSSKYAMAMGISNDWLSFLITWFGVLRRGLWTYTRFESDSLKLSNRLQAVNLEGEVVGYEHGRARKKPQALSSPSTPNELDLTTNAEGQQVPTTFLSRMLSQPNATSKIGAISLAPANRLGDQISSPAMIDTEVNVLTPSTENSISSKTNYTSKTRSYHPLLNAAKKLTKYVSKYDENSSASSRNFSVTRGDATPTQSRRRERNKSSMGYTTDDEGYTTETRTNFYTTEDDDDDGDDGDDDDEDSDNRTTYSRNESTSRLQLHNMDPSATPGKRLTSNNSLNNMNNSDPTEHFASLIMSPNKFNFALNVHHTDDDDDDDDHNHIDDITEPIVTLSTDPVNIPLSRQVLLNGDGSVGQSAFQNGDDDDDDDDDDDHDDNHNVPILMQMPTSRPQNNLNLFSPSPSITAHNKSLDRKIVSPKDEDSINSNQTPISPNPITPNTIRGNYPYLHDEPDDVEDGIELQPMVPEMFVIDMNNLNNGQNNNSNNNNKKKNLSKVDIDALLNQNEDEENI
jgi:hypothetical protein